MDWFQAHQKPHRPMLVCCNTDNQILAWGTFSDYYARAAYDITAEISIYVSETQRGQKLGQTMLQYMLDIAPSLNIKNVVAVIFGHNTPSLALFKKFGFAQWGLLPRVCELDDIEADIVLLGKRLMV
ncbi:GNAT family N-acetyltransferase [Vitreoscilla sp. C1]|uniref:GNAT family N-acetyltransferase n=1 Tax=Vitreoscilla sp. (strain C1) TaxID=96942 RepID=UPI001F2F665C|nr:GNAT family N-acetyltransferase [Vitreoscilla sp. C1]